MTIYSGIFNSVRDSNGQGDRKVNAWWFAKYFSTFIGNGVFPNPSTNLQVVANTNMNVTVKPGTGWIDGYFLYSDSDHILKLDIADGVLKRIDRIVMRLNHLTRQIDIVVKKGTFASSPVAPILQRDTDYVELALADVLINNGATQITQANITDQRLNKTVCGIVHGTVDQVDTTTIFNQYQAWFKETTGRVAGEIDAWQTQQKQEFDEWFATIQGILEGDVAANLAARIANLEQTVDDLQKTVDTKVDKHIKEDLGHVRYLGFTNSPNAWVCTSDEIIWETDVNPPRPKRGSSYRVSASNPNSGNISLSVKNSDGSKVSNSYPVLNADGSQISSNSIASGAVVAVSFSGSAFFLQGSGSGVKEVVPNNIVYDTPGVYVFTPPKGVSRILVRLWGAGGGGGARYNSNGGGGGGGGAFVLGSLDVKPGEIFTVVVGKGGRGGQTGSHNAEDGGSSFVQYRGQTFLMAGGGGAGQLGVLGGGGGGKYNQTGGQYITNAKDGVPLFQAPTPPGKAVLLASYSGGDGGGQQTQHGNGGGSAANDGGGGIKGEYITQGIASMNYFYDRGGNGGGGANYNNGNLPGIPGFGGGGGGGGGNAEDSHPMSIGTSGGNGRVHIFW
ncbi:hypothetical protein B1B04_24310 [Lysinibacillus sp. KCTC 33748]|uniref:glycine-rich domain-containing protein n=1 Tax=unclassified Lysinibacillus TaxID=2636778 RepID=UPI0009A754D0|nr:MULTISPECIES: hypothetical protein [unclassified Lysinibacillus]OXS66074.1 hypothetical protein B1B04_24310 [Lysinibacillus sp. KCTC 33748]SKC18346.1 hypothetical protein SAMN06295926_1373 [Lysinibacillus sp. AC-3]